MQHGLVTTHPGRDMRNRQKKKLIGKWLTDGLEQPMDIWNMNERQSWIASVTGALATVALCSLFGGFHGWALPAFIMASVGVAKLGCWLGELWIGR